MTLVRRAGRAKPDAVFVVDEDTLPQTLAVLRTRAEPLGIRPHVTDLSGGWPADLPEAGAFGVLLSYPGASGAVRDHRALAAAAHEAGASVVVAADLLALTLLEAPGEWGADVTVGNSQRFGVPMGFGGPHAGYMATRDELKRSMPGRLVGVTVDAQGEPAFRLALQTREQHIRREKATSNICTAQVLLAVIASMYAVYHGPEGLARIARRVHRLTVLLKQGLEKHGFTVAQRHFFDTITVDTQGKLAGIVERGRAARMNFRDAGAGRLGISLDETTTREDVEAILAVFGAGATVKVADLDPKAAQGLDMHPRFLRTSFVT